MFNYMIRTADSVAGIVGLGSKKRKLIPADQLRRHH
jgi:hypothetical protein